MFQRFTRGAITEGTSELRPGRHERACWRTREGNREQQVPRLSGRNELGEGPSGCTGAGQRERMEELRGESQAQKPSVTGGHRKVVNPRVAGSDSDFKVIRGLLRI